MSTLAQQGMKATEPLRPEIATVREVITETHNIKSLRLVFDNGELMQNFSFLPGQVAQFGVLGAGESTFAIASPPSQKEYLQFSVMRAGVVTSAIHELYEGDKVTLRAPMGCAFPTERWKGKNIVIIGGGIGMAPLRSLLLYMLDHRGDYGNITLIYGARTPADLCYEEERREWKERSDLNFTDTIDTEHPEWSGCVGLVPDVLEEARPPAENTVAITCGPPVMIKFTLHCLEKIGYKEEQVFTTLERRMKCGIGLCGRCNIGPTYVCVDGPVFSLKQLKEMPDDM